MLTLRGMMPEDFLSFHSRLSCGWLLSVHPFSIIKGPASMECNKAKNLKGCTCSYDPCANKGVCCECLRYHLRSRALPGCCFPSDAEQTYDRSFEHFARLVQEKKV
jgi:hypothetical protein